ncbi:hypothetical protein DICPUDRAFT_93366 [Dictyostelium purpureum]|uniref:GH18 domain-containing protein n=1 Tax=Dictyostelium purpureum TaxID=5786 RepID=F0Z6B7_DICPU|nr:uncharacterized protein DICPUDRAFT_93366 [Dictyostelium purpureum]EGC40412.1 hypothetical protein DICPUDRAFT_93366 [Dictyostelium purpureum]|eukprot:XP_003282959.1 hypothetical protein DICPUDRAFT_93366 [Dictyostelium purpureum]
MTKHYPFLDVSIDFNQDNLNLSYSKNIIDYQADGLVIGYVNLNEETRKPAWIYDGEKPLDWALPLINELKNSNKKVIISFGGGYGSDIEDLNSNELNNCFKEVCQLFKPNQLDLNLDSGLYSPESIDLIFKSVKELTKINDKLQISISLNITPSMGLGEEEFEIIKCAKENDINFIINGVFSDILNPDWANKLGDASIESIKQLIMQFKQVYPDSSEFDLYKRIAITPMIGLNNNSTMYTLEDSEKLSKFAYEHMLAYTSYSSLNRDHPSVNNDDSDNKFSSNNPKQSQDGQYTKLFVPTIKKDDRSI